MSAPQRNRWISAALAASLLSVPAFAQDATHDKAEALFNEGKKLMDGGHAAEGCAKLEASVGLVKGGGNTLALALCYETIGKFASAQRSFQDALKLAQGKANAEREAIAKEHLASLGAKVPQLVITGADGATVTIDGQPVSPPFSGVAVDPGTHVVKATSDAGSDTQAATAKEGQKVTVTITLGGAAPAPSATSTTGAIPPPSDPPPAGSGRKTAGYVIGGVGVAALGVGAVMGIVAHGKHKDANDVCPGKICSSQKAVDDENSAKSFAWGANVGIGLGVVGLGVATYLLVTAPSSAPAASTGVRMVPSVGKDGGGLNLLGRF